MGKFEALVGDAACSVAHQLVPRARVNVHRERRGRMPEAVRHHLDRNARGEPECRVRMAQVMQSDLGKAKRSTVRSKVRGKAVGVDRPAVVAGEDEIVVDV